MNKYLLTMVLLTVIASLTCFACPNPVTAQTNAQEGEETVVGETTNQLKKALRQVLAIWKEAHQTITKTWRENILPKIEAWFEKKKPDIGEEFEKEKGQLKEEIKESFSQLWQWVKDLIK